MSTVLDYVGRRVDLVVYHGVAAGGPYPLTPVLAEPGQPGKVVAGVQKLVQRFLIELFTERGSVAFDEERGCDFFTELRSGNIRSQADVFSAFARAVNTLQPTLLAEESSDDPDDERYGSVTALSVTVTGADVVMEASIISRAGTGTTFLFPIESVS